MEPEFFASSGRETSVSSGIIPRATPSLSIPLEELGFPASFDKNPRFLSREEPLRKSWTRIYNLKSQNNEQFVDQ